MVEARAGSEGARERRLLEAGWEWSRRGGLIVWRRLDGRGSWYRQEVALELLEFSEVMEEEQKGGRDDV